MKKIARKRGWLVVLLLAVLALAPIGCIEIDVGPDNGDEDDARLPAPAAPATG